jgi:hypothetical protein
MSRHERLPTYLPTYLPLYPHAEEKGNCRVVATANGSGGDGMAAVVMFLECWKLEVAEKVLFFD